MSRPRTGARLASPIVALALCLAPAAAAAGDLDVNASAAFTGLFGLEASVGSACPPPIELVLSGGGIVFGTQQACGRLTALDVTTAGATLLRAGESVAMGEGFAVGALSSLAVELQSDLSPFAWVGDDSPTAEPTYRAAFRVNIDDLALPLAGNEELGHFEGRSGDGRRWLQVILKRNLIPFENRLILVALEDGGGEVRLPFGEELLLPAGWNLVELEWTAGSGSGELLVSLNGAPFVGLENLDNDTGRIDFVRWGAVSGEIPNVGGSLYLDDFTSSE